MLVCDFHREQAWHRYLVKNDNGIPKDSQATIKTMLRRVASSKTEEDYEMAKEAFKCSAECQANPTLKAYIEQQWFNDEMYKVSKTKHRIFEFCVL